MPRRTAFFNPSGEKYGLDAPLKERILSYFERVIAEWHVPTVYVSHDADEVRRLADRVVVLEGGKVRGSGTADEVLCQRHLSG